MIESPVRSLPTPIIKLNLKIENSDGNKNPILSDAILLTDLPNCTAIFVPLAMVPISEESIYVIHWSEFLMDVSD